MVVAIVAILAAIGLVAIDFVLMASAFLYEPPDDWLVIAWFALFVVAIASRRRWLVFAAHNVITVVMIVRLVQYYQMGLNRQNADEPKSVLFVVGAILFTNILAWLVARALPRRPWFRRADGGHSAAGR